MCTIEKAGGRRAGSGRERGGGILLAADPALRPLAFSISLTESLEQAIWKRGGLRIAAIVLMSGLDASMTLLPYFATKTQLSGFFII